MPTHDIIANRNEKLVEHIKRILSPTQRARFAVRCENLAKVLVRRIEERRLRLRVEARVRIELTYKGFADLSLTTWVPRQEQ